MRITREENDSFKDDKTGIGQLSDGSIDTFPLSEWPKRKAEREAMEKALEDAFSEMYPLAMDNGYFDESKHKRDSEGKFSETAGELEKAAKNTALPMSSSTAPLAVKAIKEFNDKYAGKTGLSESQLTQKIADYRAVQKTVQQADKLADTFAKFQAKEKAEQKARKAAEQAAEQLSKNKKVMESLGISEQQAGAITELAKMMEAPTEDLVDLFKEYEKNIEHLKLPINGFQVALIKNYTNGGYTSINEALRTESWTPAQEAYASLLNKALMTMPKYTGSGLTRNVLLSSELQSVYAVGKMVEEKAFMSTSKDSLFSGNTQFKVTAKGKRGVDVDMISENYGEKEVLFAARTYFKVTKIEGKPGGPMMVHLEEWDEDQ